MAGGVNVKMGVTGIAQFKQSINQARQNMKTLDAQLALTEKQYKATGDSETYMQQKTEQLQAKLAEQKAVAENAEKALREMAEKGVDRSSKAFQEMQRAMIQAKGDMLDTENALNNVTTAEENAGNEAETMNRQLKDIGKGIGYENVTNALGKITDGMEAVMKKAVNVGKAIVQDVLGAGSWADDLATRASYFGLTTEQLQRMEKTATLIDTPVDAILNAQKKLRKGLGSHDTGVMGGFAALFGEGYDVDAKGWEQAFWDVGEAIMKFADEEEREVYAQRMFGRSWNELIPLFEAGKQAYDELNESWNVVPEESLQALTDMDDQYQKMNNELETVKRTLEAALAPAVTNVLEILTGLMQEFNTYLQSEQGQERLASLGDAVSALFDDLKNIDPEDVMNNIIGIFERLKEGLEWVKNNKQGIVDAVKAFIAAWAGLKTAQGVSTALQLLKGLGLIAGGGTTAAAATAATTGTTTAAAGTTGAMGVASLAAEWGAFSAGGFTGMGIAALPVIAVAATAYFQGEVEKQWAQTEQHAQKVAEAAKALGEDAEKDAETLLQIAHAANPLSNRSGNYIREAEELRILNNADRNQLMSDVLKYGEKNGFGEITTSSGYYLANELQAYWHGVPLEQQRIEAMMDALQQMYENKLSTEAFGSSLMMGLGSPLDNPDIMQRLSDAVIEVNETNKQNGQDISDAAKKMEKLPGETADAVRGALSDLNLYIDGRSVTAVISEIQASYVLNGNP